MADIYGVRGLRCWLLVCFTLVILAIGTSARAYTVSEGREYKGWASVWYPTLEQAWETVSFCAQTPSFNRACVITDTEETPYFEVRVTYDYEENQYGFWVSRNRWVDIPYRQTSCPAGHYMMADGTCQEELPSCEIGEVLNPVTDECEMCAAGTVWDFFTKSCIDEDEYRCEQFGRDNFRSFGGGSTFMGGPTIRKGNKQTGDYCIPDDDDPDKGCFAHWRRDMTGGSGDEQQTWGRWTESKAGPCTPDEEDEDETFGPEDCPPGQMRGVINDKIYCYIPGPEDEYHDETTKTETKTEDLGDGRTKETTTTTTTTTNCSGGSCNTTTIIHNEITIYDSYGVPEGESETSTETFGTDDSFRGFCADNPSSVICREAGLGSESRIGGSCAQGFSCQGDAIQCAIYREQHIRACQLFEPQGTEEEGLYADAGGELGDQLDQLDQGEVAIDTLFDDTDQLSGACPADPVVVVLDQSITIPYHIICDNAHIFRAIIRAVGGVLWLVIVFG